MTTLDTLKKIIPADQALANQALSRGLRQVKDIFNTDLPTMALVIANLETNKDLDLVNALTELLPANVAAFYANTFATGTGPGNSITVADVLGTASGNTMNTELPTVIEIVGALGNTGALDSLTANGGTPASATNGVYTVMQFCLAGDYTTVIEIDPGDPGADPPVPPTFSFTIDIPAPLPGQGVYGPANNLTAVIDPAFVNLISNANIAITNIAAANPAAALATNTAYANMATQLQVNVVNCTAAGIDIGNLVSNIANADVESNSTATVMSFVSSLHDIGLDVSQGGQSQFVQEVSNVSTLSGQAMIASMREGRNIAILNAAGMLLDTQISEINPATPIANNLGNAQYTVAEARANIIF